MYVCVCVCTYVRVREKEGRFIFDPTCYPTRQTSHSWYNDRGKQLSPICYPEAPHPTLSATPTSSVILCQSLWPNTPQDSSFLYLPRRPLPAGKTAQHQGPAGLCSLHHAGLF